MRSFWSWFSLGFWHFFNLNWLKETRFIFTRFSTSLIFHGFTVYFSFGNRMIITHSRIWTEALSRSIFIQVWFRDNRRPQRWSKLRRKHGIERIWRPGLTYESSLICVRSQGIRNCRRHMKVLFHSSRATNWFGGLRYSCFKTLRANNCYYHTRLATNSLKNLFPWFIMNAKWGLAFQTV